MKTTTQRGFAIVELLLVLVIVGIIAFVAWRVIEASGTVDNTASQAGGTTVPISESDAVPEVSNTKDLDALSQQLDNTQIDDDTELELQEQSTF